MAKSIQTNPSTGRKSIIDDVVEETGKVMSDLGKETGKVIEEALTVDWGEAAKKDHSKFDWGAGIANYASGKSGGR